MSFSIDELRNRNTLSINGINKGKGEVVCSSSANNSLATLRKQISQNKNTGVANIEKRITAVSNAIIEETSKTYREQTIEILTIIDESYSCSGTEAATCNGYNQLINDEKKECLPTIVTSVLFSGYQNEVTFRTNIDQVPALSYCADGDYTAIYDTICTYIHKIIDAQNNSLNKPKKTICAIMTDGIDNYSKKYSLLDTRNLIQMAKNMGWEFIFLGAMDSAYEVGVSLGINIDNIARICMSDSGIQANFKSIHKAIKDVRNNGKISTSWKHAIQEHMALEDKGNQKRLELGIK